MESLTSGVDIYHLQGDVRALLFTKALPELSSPVANVIFERKFYDDLLYSVRRVQRVALLSNPGVSKSVFHYYYLARLFNPRHFEALPPDCWGSTEIPHVVIRQISNKSMHVFFIREKLCFNAPCDYQTLHHFNPRTTIYLYEPGDSLQGPYYLQQTMPILATMSLNPVRYHEFCKNKGKKRFMPLYTEEELVAIAGFTRSRGGDVTDEVVRQRFKEFGGIIRHILFSDEDDLDEVRLAVEEAITECDVYKLLNLSNIENPSVSHFIMQYDVQRCGERAFRDRQVVFTGADMERRLQSKVFSIDLLAMRRLLTAVDEKRSTLASEPAARLYFQNLVYMTIVSISGVNWLQRLLGTYTSTTCSLY